MLLARHVAGRPPVESANALDTITLDREARYRRRVRLVTDGGRDLLLDLAVATYLADGDALVTDEGLVVVRAAAESLMEVRARDALHLARIAWHIGNRHTPAEITSDAIYLQRDHVLEDMIQGLGGDVRHVMRPFEPEGGAYGRHGALEKGHHHHSDAHGHSHEHAHSHGHQSSMHAPRVWKGGA